MGPGDRGLTLPLPAYLDEVALPALFDRLPVAFPEFGWERDADGWQATSDETTKRVLGARAERVVCHRPFGFYAHGGGSCTWVSYVAGVDKPRGQAWVEATRKLCELAGVEFPSHEGSNPLKVCAEAEAANARRAALGAVVAVLQRVWAGKVPLEGDAAAQLEQARVHMVERGISIEAARELGLGFYPSAAVVARELPTEVKDAAREAGLLKNRWAGFVAFPWLDEWGRPLTLYFNWHQRDRPLRGDHPGWRGGDRDGEAIPKKVALAGKRTKRSPLYFDRARKARVRDLVLVEGLIDSAVLQGLGEAGVVACVAAQLSRDQVETLKRAQVRSVTICLDPDGAGAKGTLACVRDLRAAGINAYVAPTLPDGLDPDELVLRDGVEAWCKHVAQAVSGTAYRARLALEGVAPDCPDLVRDKALAELREVAADADAVELEGLVKQLQQATGMGARPARAALKGGRDNTYGPPEEADAGENDSQATRLRKLVEARADLYRDMADRAVVSYDDGGLRRVSYLNSSAFKHWMSNTHYELEGEVVPRSAIGDALEALKGLAARKPQKDVHLRVAQVEGRVYLDLCDDRWRVAEVTAQGWRVLDRSPVPFVRRPGMQPLPEPKRGGDLEQLRPFVNVDDHGWLLVRCWLVGALRGLKPYWVAILQGEHGCAKSTTSAVLRKLIDPNEAGETAPPGDERDLIIAADNAHVYGVDNLSGCPAWFSDSVCRLSTGAGFRTRALFTDDEERIFKVARPAVLNGIDQIAVRPDLASRSLVLSLPRVPDEDRMQEGALWAQFEAARPLILGALLDAVACALGRVDGIGQVGYRMADPAAWSMAAAPAMGLSEFEVDAALARNMDEMATAGIEADEVASAVVDVLREKYVWMGSTRDLLERLGEEVGDVARSKYWPKTARALSNRLKRAMPVLRSAGVEVERRTLKGRAQLTLRMDSGE